MATEYVFKSGGFFAQAYGTDSYGEQVYSDTSSSNPSEPATNPGTTTTAPNTGFLGMSQEAAVASSSGALLIAVALVGTVYVIVNRRRRVKKGSQE